MRRSKAVWSVAAILGAVIIFFAGMAIERWSRGRWYEVHDQKEYSAASGKVVLKHITDTQGFPFLDPGDSAVSFKDESGLETKLYQSKRTFQENYQWVDEIKVDGDAIEWSDGIYHFSLKMERYGPTTRGS